MAHSLTTTPKTKRDPSVSEWFSPRSKWVEVFMIFCLFGVLCGKVRPRLAALRAVSGSVLGTICSARN